MRTITVGLTKYLESYTNSTVSTETFLEEFQLDNKEAILELFNYIINLVNTYEQGSNMASLILRSTILIKEFLNNTVFEKDELDSFKRKSAKAKARLLTLKDIESTKTRKSHLNKAISNIEKMNYRLDRSCDPSFSIIKKYIKQQVSIDYIVDVTNKYPFCFEEVNNGITIYDFIIDEFLCSLPSQKNDYTPYYLLKLLKIFRDRAIILSDNYQKRINKLEQKRLSKSDEVLLKEFSYIINNVDYSLSSEEILNKYGKKKYRELSEHDFATILLPNNSLIEDRRIITIDPSLSSLKDDAVSIKKDGNDYILGIHVTDVAGKVMEDTLVDRLTFQNFKTYYEGPIKSIEMIDPKFAFPFFSLDEGKTKPVLSLYVRLSPEGTIKDYHFNFDEIHIDKSLTYEEADEILASSDDKELQSDLIDLIEISNILKTSNNGTSYREIKDILRPESYEDYAFNSHEIITESMVLYNRLMAILFSNDNEAPFIYRVHKKPTDEAFKSMISSLTVEELKSLKNNAGVIKTIKEFYPKAEYSTVNYGHYGLGIDAYAHSTSPGRRYPDLLAQRLYYELFFTPRTIEKVERYAKLVEEYSEAFNFESLIQADYHKDTLTLKKK